MVCEIVSKLRLTITVEVKVITHFLSIIIIAN